LAALSVAGRQQEANPQAPVHIAKAQKVQAAYTAADLEADPTNKPTHRRNVEGLHVF
jgi:hypothetical protein